MWTHLQSTLYRICKRTRVHTVRHTFSFGAVAVAAALATVLLSTSNSYIRLVTDDAVVEAGDTFMVAVYVGAQESVNAIDIGVSFPNELVTVEGIDVGRSVISLWTQDPFVEGDTVVLRGGTYRRGFIGEHLIAEIRFQAQQSGRAEFLIQDRTLLSGDGTGTEVTGIDVESVAVVAREEDGTISADVGVRFVTDLDASGSVTLRDVEAFLSAWQSRSVVYDFNGDGKMNFTDFAIILADSFFN